MAFFKSFHPIEKKEKTVFAQVGGSRIPPAGLLFGLTSFLVWQKFWRSALFQTNAVYGGTYPAASCEIS